MYVTLEQPKYNALDLAKYIVTKCVWDASPVSNLQLQKILYYIQRDFLKSGKYAYADRIEAWQFGPVVPEVYYYFSGFGAMSIVSTFDPIPITEQDAAVIDSIVEQKRILAPWDLVAETHKKGGAWDRVYNNGMGNRQTIPVGLIKAVG